MQGRIRALVGMEPRVALSRTYLDGLSRVNRMPDVSYACTVCVDILTVCILGDCSWKDPTACAVTSSGRVCARMTACIHLSFPGGLPSSVYQGLAQ